MGERKRAGTLLEALFSPVERRVLALLFGQPRRRFQSGELLRLVQGGTGGVHRLLTRFADAGLLKVTWIGNQKYYQANEGCRIYPELCGLIAKTVGIVEPLEQMLRPFERKIRAAFIYGSVGKHLESPDVRIDVVIISDELDHTDLATAIDAAEKVLGHTITPLVIQSREWRLDFRKQGSLIGRIAGQPRQYLVGSHDAVRAIESISPFT
jgi:hypothetical protein